MKLRQWSIIATPLVALVALGIGLAPPAGAGEKGEDKKIDKKGGDFKPIKIDGNLADNDPKDKKLTESPAKIHKVKLTQGRNYEIRLNSDDFDAFLRIEDGDGKELAFDDDSGGGLNSRLLFSPPKTGEYAVIATSLDSKTGKFLLTINDKGAPAKLAGKKLQLNEQGGATVTDKLAEGDTPNPIGIFNGQVTKGHPCKIYAVELKAGTGIQINLDSDDFDAVLIVTDAKGKVVAFNDDANGTLNSEIKYRAANAGAYNIIATSLNNAVGDYTLKVQTKAGEKGGDKGGDKGEKGEKGVKVNARKLVLNKQGGATVTDKLAEGDTPNQVGILNGEILKGHTCKVYTVELKGDKNYVINLDSDDFDAVLVLTDGNRKVLAFNDDANGTLNSEITFRAPEDGMYQIIATSLDKKLGEYTLKVRLK